jgi:hypothetical protein
MSEIARDSGIVADDDSSETSSMRACDDCSSLSYVQRLRKRFELLSKENDKEFHSNCNWWLDEEPVQDEEEEVIEAEEEEEPPQPEYETQTSVNSQRSIKSYKSLHSHESVEKEEEQKPVLNLPRITLDSVDDDDDEVFESADDIEEEIEAQFIRRNSARMRLSRPPSITSQTSK